MNISKMTIDIPTEFKNQVKANAAIVGKKMKDYVLEALTEKIQRDKLEDKYLGDLAMKADKEGYIGAKESEELLNEMINPKKS